MNLLDAYVVEILGEPEYKYCKWFVKVKYNCYGIYSEGEVMLNSYAEAKAVQICYKFLT